MVFVYELPNEEYEGEERAPNGYLAHRFLHGKPENHPSIVCVEDEEYDEGDAYPSPRHSVEWVDVGFLFFHDVCKLKYYAANIDNKFLILKRIWQKVSLLV